MKKTLLTATALIILIDVLLILYYLNLRSNLPSLDYAIQPLTQAEIYSYENSLSRISSTLNLGEVINRVDYYNKSAFELIGFTEENNVVEAFAIQFDYTMIDSDEPIGSGLIYAVRLNNETDYTNQFINQCNGDSFDEYYKGLSISICSAGNSSSAKTVKKLILYGVSFTNLSSYRSSLNQLSKILDLVN